MAKFCSNCWAEKQQNWTCPKCAFSFNSEVIRLEDENKTKSSSVQVDTEWFSVWLCILLFLIPILSPIVALFKLKFWILILWIIGAVMAFIPFVWRICAFIIHIIVIASLSKTKNKVKVELNQQ